MHCAANGKAIDVGGDDELDVAAWGEPEVDLAGEDDEANGDLLDEDGHVETGLEGGDEDDGWEMEVSAGASPPPIRMCRCDSIHLGHLVCFTFICCMFDLIVFWVD